MPAAPSPLSYTGFDGARLQEIGFRLTRFCIHFSFLPSVLYTFFLFAVLSTLCLYLLISVFFLQSHFICNLHQYIQQIVYKRTQGHVEECSVALLCN
jgi:hypothetical protein